MTRPLKLAGQIVALACVAGLLGLLVWRLTHQQHAPRIGSPAPGFTLHRLGGSGGTVSLAELRGRPVVLNFWASWCVGCKADAKVLERAYSHYSRRGVVFLGVDWHDLASDARRFVAANGVRFPMLEDGSGAVTASYGISQAPETYIVGRSGRIVAHIPGSMAAAALASEFREGLAEALRT